MNPSTRRIAAFAIVLLLGGCAVAPEGAPRFAQAPAAPPGHATVYVYRMGAAPYTRNIKVSIAGKPLLEAPEQAYTWQYVPAGTHTVFAEWPRDFLAPKKWPDASATVDFQAGESYFFRVAGTIDYVPVGFFSPGGIVHKSFLVRMPQDVGTAQLTACCRYMPAASDRLQ